MLSALCFVCCLDYIAVPEPDPTVADERTPAEIAPSFLLVVRPLPRPALLVWDARACCCS